MLADGLISRLRPGDSILRPYLRRQLPDSGSKKDGTETFVFLNLGTFGTVSQIKSFRRYFARDLIKRMHMRYI